VLSDPPATAYFEQFGDSTLDLKARLYLANLDQRLPTRHDLHSQIKKRFAAAGIEISFPQRDLHLRSVPKDLASILNRDKQTPPAAEVSNAPPQTAPTVSAAIKSSRVQGE
jgi:potassium efflux system protein